MYTLSISEANTDYNYIIESTGPFTATIEVVKGEDSQPITGNNSHIYEGVYDSANSRFASAPNGLSLSYYTDGLSIVKITPTSSDPSCIYVFDDEYIYPITKIGNSYYVMANGYIPLKATAPFTADIEIFPILESGAAPVPGQTAAVLSAEDAGEYYCVITWPDGYSLTSDTIRYSDSDNELWGWNPLIVLLLLKRSIRYYDGDKRVDIYKISELGVEIVEPLKLEDKDGMTLEGWYIDKELTEKFDFTKPVEKGIALYAKWVPIETTEEVQ